MAWPAGASPFLGSPLNQLPPSLLRQDVGRALVPLLPRAELGGVSDVSGTVSVVPTDIKSSLDKCSLGLDQMQPPQSPASPPGDVGERRGTENGPGKRMEAARMEEQMQRGRSGEQEGFGQAATERWSRAAAEPS